DRAGLDRERVEHLHPGEGGAAVGALEERLVPARLFRHGGRRAGDVRVVERDGDLGTAPVDPRVERYPAADDGERGGPCAAEVARSREPDAASTGERLLPHRDEIVTAA